MMKDGCHVRGGVKSPRQSKDVFLYYTESSAAVDLELGLQNPSAPTPSADQTHPP